MKLPEDEIEPAKCPYCDLALVNLRIMPGKLDRPPRFEPGFIGLTDFSYFERIEDYDYHCYDDAWNVFANRDTQAEKDQRRQDQLLHLQAIGRRKEPAAV